MRVKTSDLVLKPVRRVIPITIEGENTEIKIFNLLNEERMQVMDELRKVSSKEMKEKDIRRMYKILLEKCTDLKLDGDLIEMLNSPTVELMQVQIELQEILHELECEEMISRIAELNKAESMLYAQLALKKTERIDNLLQKISELTKEEE